MSQDELLEAADRNEKQQQGGGGGGVQERIEKTIQLEETDSKRDVLAGTVFAPKLVLRCRKAGPSDIKFLRDFEGTKHGKKLGVYAEATFVGPKVHSVHRLKRETRPSERKKGLLEHRVKPGPDPAREEQQTKWLTEQEIEKEAYQPSTSWIESGSGDLGKLYVEIIGCDGLPNLDIGLGTRDKSDPFCTIIFEDAIASTEVINDCLSPRWMPWSQRAFVFRVEHMSSQLLIGVFDYDNPTVNPHDAIGRVSIDTTNFRNDTVYILHYDLHTSTLNENRETCGRLTVRVRLDSNLNPRNALLSSMRLPTQNYINVAQKTAFKNARFVCSGEEDMNLLDIDAIKSYRQELMDYKGVLIYIFDAVKIVILWRGHFDVSFWKLKLKLPLHSITAFLMGIFLVENYNLIPSCTLFCITWLLFATNEERHRNPSPWMGALTIREMWYAIATGKIWQETIVADENKPLIEKYEATRAERLKDIEGQMKKQQETSERTNSLFKYEEEETAVNESQTDITTKTGNFSLNPLKPVLLPIQKILGSVCVGLRVGRSILTWDESFYAFIIAHACLIAGIAIIWVPWSWLIRWLLRIVVWVCLGPWFGYTLDFCFVRKLERHSSTTLFHRFEKSLEKTIEERGANLALRKRQAAINKENALKLRSVKQYMFGNYIVRVPRFKEYRWTDVPRPESTATPVEPGYSNVVITDRKHGQRLVGDMIPVWGDAKELSISQVDAKHESLQQQLGRGVAENVIAPGYGAIDTVAKPFIGVASRVTKPLVGSISSARTKAMDKVNPMKVFKRSYHG